MINIPYSQSDLFTNIQLSKDLIKCEKKLWFYLCRVVFSGDVLEMPKSIGYVVIVNVIDALLYNENGRTECLQECLQKKK